MILRALSAIAVVGLAAFAASTFAGWRDGIGPGDSMGAAVRFLPPLGVALAAALTVWAQFRAPASVLFVAGVGLLGGAMFVEPNFAIWVGLLGDGLFAPLRTGRDAVVMALAGVWLLFLFGARSDSLRSSDHEVAA